MEARVVREGTEWVGKCMVAVKDETLIFEEDGGERRQATFGALAVGQQMQVSLAELVGESYPAQVDAGQTVIVK